MKDISETSQSICSDVKRRSQKQKTPQNSLRGKNKKESHADTLESVDSEEQGHRLLQVGNQKIKISSAIKTSD